MISLQKLFELDKNDGESNNTVEHKYTDYSGETGGDSFAKLSFLASSSRASCVSTSSKASSGITVPFPLKLHEMLDQIEEDGLASVISWQPHGRCFVVHDQKRFASDVMVKYFRQTKFASFQRQLNLYGFNRLTSGRDKGGYYNELFLRSKRFLCHRIQRIKIKGTGVRKASSPETEPQFYSMPPVGIGGKDSGKVKQTKNNKNDSNTHANATPSGPTPSLSVSMDGYPHWSQQLAMNQPMLNNQGFSQHDALQLQLQQQHQTSSLQNPLATLSACSSSSPNNINDLQRMIMEQQAKLSLAQTAIQQAAAVFPNMQAASAVSLLQSMANKNSLSQQHGQAQSFQMSTPNHIASMMQQKLDEQSRQQYRHSRQKQQAQQQYSTDEDSDEDDSQKEFDQILGALMDMPTEPTPTQIASNPLANDTSLANLYEMITD